MALASEALANARTHLNDEQGSLWPNQKLFPKLKVAYNEMLNEFLVNGVPIINAVTAVLTVPAFVTPDLNLDLSTVANYPTDIYEPIWMKERAVGQQDQDFVDMTKVDFIPNLQKGNNQLIWWSWIGGTIKVLGCMAAVQVQLRYRKILTPPRTVTDSLVVTLAETFLGPETAYLAITSLANFDKNVAQVCKNLAERNLENIIAEAVKGEQNLPAKRRPYHRGRGRSRAIRDF